MYAIYAGEVQIYADAFALPGMQVLEPRLSLEDNKAGTLTMTLPPDNRGYDTVKRLTTDIRVTRDGKEIWAGRVLEETRDFYNCRVLTCEGELAFFNDTVQPPHEYAEKTVRGYLEALIQVHNEHTPENRHFQIGIVTVVDDSNPTRYTNYETTMELMGNLVEQYGGHMRVRKDEEGVRRLDYLKEYADTSTQVIQFGSNLIDFTRNWDSSAYATAIVPLGKTLKSGGGKAPEDHLTVAKVNNGSIYVSSAEAVEAFGWIARTVHWDDVSDAEVLLDKAKKYLSELQFDNLELEVSALDLNYMSVDHEAIKLLDEVRVISRPHGLDSEFPVTKLDIPLDNPENTKFTMGSNVKTSLTAANDQANRDVLDKIEIMPKTLLEEAKENATQIMNSATTGYITITKTEQGSEAILITDTLDYTAATKMWKWSMNGLGYSNDGGKTFVGPAITMEGVIVADYITTGHLSADRIQGGILKSTKDNTEFNLNTGALTMKSGSIYIGQASKELTEEEKTEWEEQIKSETAAAFMVDKNGNLYARRGTFAGAILGSDCEFGGKLVAATGDFKGTVQAEDFLDREGKSMMNGEKFKGQYLDLIGINITNNAGKTVIKIDENGVHFGSETSPIKSLFAESRSGPWHNTMLTGDKFRKDYLGVDKDGNAEWGEAYQFVGEDGKPGTPGNNGSDAEVTFDNILAALYEAEQTKTTFITASKVGAPTIYGAHLYGAKIYAGGVGEKGGQVISLTDDGIEIFDGHGFEIIKIYKNEHGYASIYSPYDGFTIGGPSIRFQVSQIDFSEVKAVKGLHATFA